MGLKWRELIIKVKLQGYERLLFTPLTPYFAESTHNFTSPLHRVGTSARFLSRTDKQKIFAGEGEVAVFSAKRWDRRNS